GKVIQLEKSEKVRLK
ncbi:DUF2292 domain-containing protein, partial [Bacillus thuringiensis]